MLAADQTLAPASGVPVLTVDDDDFQARFLLILPRRLDARRKSLQVANPGLLRRIYSGHRGYGTSESEAQRWQ